jgi:hypothetical protein
MPVGFESFTSTGQPLFKVDSSLVKFLGTASIGTSHTGTANSGSLTDSRFTAYSQHTPFVMTLTARLNPDGDFPVFSFSGTTLLWEYPRGGAAGETWTRPDTVFVYGIA